MNNETKKGKLVPELRFPGFEGEWEEKRLGNVCNVVDDKCDIGSLTIVTYISTENMLQDFEGVKIASKLPNSGSFTQFNKGDILFSNIRPYLKKVWQAVFDGAASNDVIVFRTLDGYDRLFVSLVIKSDRFIAHSMSGAKGVKMPRGDKKMMLDYLFSIPSLPEQQKIAECLSSVDDLIQAEADQLQALKDHKKGLMQQLFPQEGETTPKLRFPGFEGEWEEKKLGEIADKCTSRNRDKSETRVLTNSATEGVVDQNAYFDRDIAVKENTDNYHIVDLDDFVYNPRISTSAPVGPISRNKIGRGIMSPLYSVFRFKSENIDYLEHFFSTTIWHRYLKSVANYGARFDRMAISTEDFYSMPILCPDPSEQQKIASCLSSLDEGIAAQQEKVEALKEHKKGLMQKLFPSV